MILWAIAFAGLAGLLSLIATTHPGPLWVRLPFVALSAWLAFAVYGAAQPSRGWPTPSAPPKSAAFAWGVIREPSDGDKGEIDLWLTPRGSERPRAYRLPYSRELHRQVQRAINVTRGGHAVTVARRGRRSGQRGDSRGGRFHFYRTPAVRLPAKGQP